MRSPGFLPRRASPLVVCPPGVPRDKGSSDKRFHGDVALGTVSAPQRPNDDALQTRRDHSSGKDPLGEAQPRFSVKFYLVAMLFILFDIEIVFMYPWAVAYRDYIEKYGSWTIFGSMLSFVTILMVGFVYALKKGALDWKR